MENTYENGTNVPVIDIPVEGNAEIIPVNNNGDLEEITPMQMAVGGALTMAIGYGIGKLMEVITRKWIHPLITRWADKIRSKNKKDELETPPAAENSADPEKRKPGVKAAQGMRNRRNR